MSNSNQKTVAIEKATNASERVSADERAMNEKIASLSKIRKATKDLSPAIRKISAIVRCIDVLLRKGILESEASKLKEDKAYYLGLKKKLVSMIPG